ncbi:ExbD/TolR family protein [Bdellovibrio bacteriovorus]|uniref:ExbD/TolR family protein n=1 Tax=Bdellovibrio bacteriovorus TaxID=959 RepID=UPI0035A65D45
MRKSLLENAASPKRSPMTESLTLSSGGKKKGLFRRELALALPLTSLIDAFSIIVIYLLIGTQNSGMETQIPNKMTLPSANHSQGVEKITPILRIEKGNYFLDDKRVAANDLTNKLAELKKNTEEKELELMVQADTEMRYADLDPLLKAGSLAGIEKLKFAVVPGK